MNDKKYEISIDPHILELLGPNLYTNIYYVLAELVANAYDADATNVYIIIDNDAITVEDDGKGMSYDDGDIKHYLKVAASSREDDESSFTKIFKRARMGRKGIGKLAALSVSKKVYIKTIKDGEKSGFILQKEIKDNELPPLSEEEINFLRVKGNHGTSICMKDPLLSYSKRIKDIGKNIVRLFPLRDEDFKIHIISGNKEEVIEKFEEAIVPDLATLITLGEEFESMADLYSGENKDKLVECLDEKQIPIEMNDNQGVMKEYTIKIKGWIGAYRSTKGRKSAITDFPDNYISLYANKKMGEFNILPIVGSNRLEEVYVVGQLHVDIFELTELPDMALSNRQGYQSSDKRYLEVIAYVKKELLPKILAKRKEYVKLGTAKKEEKEKENLEKAEEELKNSIDNYTHKTIEDVRSQIEGESGFTSDQIEQVSFIVENTLNNLRPQLGIKTKVDGGKKKILISHASEDCDVADLIYKMLQYNGIDKSEIIYTSSHEVESDIPFGEGIYEYLEKFFVDSYSSQKMYVIFITSEIMAHKWGPVLEAGAAWITKMDHFIITVDGYRPEEPLNTRPFWCSIKRENGKLVTIDDNQVYQLSKAISSICERLKGESKTIEENKGKLKRLLTV